MNKNKLQTADEIGALIRNIRKEQHISQEELAGLAGTGVRFISELENGKATVQLDKLLKVIEALGMGLYIFNRWDYIFLIAGRINNATTQCIFAQSNGRSA